MTTHKQGRMPRRLLGPIRALPLALLLIAPVATAGSGFNGDGPINLTADGIAVKGYDLVAYFRRGEPVEGSPEHEYRHRGATFRFASAQNLERFAARPEKYMPAYGGYCALGVANGYKDDMHPAAFEIVDGRLFFNLTPRINQYWNFARSFKNLIEQADANWPALRHQPGYGPADAH